MTKRKGRKHTPEVEAQLVLATLMSDQTLAERAQQYDIHPNQITDSFRLDAVRDAIRRHGCPEIFNTDQACPSSPDESIGLLQAHDLGISNGGRGPWRGKVFVDRLWKTVKDEEVFLKACGGACFVALASAIRNAA